MNWETNRKSEDIELRNTGILPYNVDIENDMKNNQTIDVNK